MNESEFTANWSRWCASASFRGASDPEGAVQDAVVYALGRLPFEDARFAAYVTVRIKETAKTQRRLSRMAARLSESMVPWIRAGHSTWEACEYAMELYPQDRIGRENRAKSQCPQGHPYSADNTKVIRGKRYCRTCKREGMRRFREKQRRAS